MAKKKQHDEELQRGLEKLRGRELKIIYEDLRKVIREEPVPTVGGIETIVRSLKGQIGGELDPQRVIDQSFFVK